MAEILPICPFTGLSTEGKAKLTYYQGNRLKILYEFQPIGRAVFSHIQLDLFQQEVTSSQFKPKTAVAGMCREASELGREPVMVTGPIYRYTEGEFPKSFEEKRLHFLFLLNETGGNVYKTRDVIIEQDFPLAYADSGDEFKRIIRSLLDDNLLIHNGSALVRGDKPHEVFSRYGGLMPSSNGKKLIAKILHRGAVTPSPELAPATSAPELLSVPPISITHLHPTVQQAVGSRFADCYYSDALHKACTALEKAVQDKANQPAEPTGATLMSKVFSKDRPLLTVSSNQGEQEGYMFLYRGLAQAIRNHYAHNDPATDPARALEWLGFISALFYKLDEAQLTATPAAP
jgi:uncharacterized protein (TIGR02391 family)